MIVKLSLLLLPLLMITITTATTVIIILITIVKTRSLSALTHPETKAISQMIKLPKVQYLHTAQARVGGGLGRGGRVGVCWGVGVGGGGA